MEKAMNLLKRLLWLWRVSQGIAEVKQLAEEHADDPEYCIESALHALSIFEELSSYAQPLRKTTPEEGEIIEVMFLKRWDRLRRISVFADML